MRLAIQGSLLSAALAQQTNLDPTQDFCRRHAHQTCMIDNILYIDGGMMYLGIDSVQNTSVAIANAWIISEDTSRATNTEFGFPVQHIEGQKAPGVPSVNNGVLWPDQANKLFYLYGGEHNNGTTPGFDGSLWFYDTINKSWNRTTPGTQQTNINSGSWPAHGSGTVDDDGRAYYYGGYLNKQTMPDWDAEPLMLNGLVAYDMNTHHWSNQTADVPRAEGSLHYIAAGKKGSLVYFGGVEISSGTRQYTNMSEIHVYDIASSRWYTQAAGGDIPSSRRGMCAGVTWAADRSSYNIYMWGGMNGTDFGLGDLYVLTIPRFKWIALYPKPMVSFFPGGRVWASCNVFNGGSQMMVIGGKLTNLSRVECDVPVIGGQHGLLLGQENNERDAYASDTSYANGTDTLWHAPMDNVTSYRVPYAIIDEVGGGENGGATRKGPADGFATEDLETVFRQTYIAAERTATRTDLLTSTNSASPGATTNSLSGGAIGGIVAGALVAIIAILVAVTSLLKKKKRGKVDTEVQQVLTAEMEDQDATLAKKKWFLRGQWRSEAEVRSDPHELDSKIVRVIEGPPVELDSSEVRDGGSGPAQIDAPRS